jgi:hypothetical protein
MLFVADDGGVGASHRQDVPAFDSAEAATENDRVLLDCLGHVSFCEGLIFELEDYHFSV